jgi:hypothetical protein
MMDKGLYAPFITLADLDLAWQLVQAIRRKASL